MQTTNNQELEKLCDTAIASHIPELSIDFDQEQNGYYWCFRCVDSRDEGYPIFSSPVEAVVHFTAMTIKDMDEEMGINDDDDGEEWYDETLVDHDFEDRDYL